MNNSLIKRIKNYISFETIILDEDYFIDITYEKKRFLLIPSNYNSWEEITTCIDSHINREINIECPICFNNNNDSEIRRVSCPSCANDWCTICYLTMIRDGIKKNDFVSCPFCRISFGKEIIPCYTVKSSDNVSKV